MNTKFYFILLLFFSLLSGVSGAEVGSKITSPQPGSTLDTTSVTFEWEDTGALFYGITIYQNDTSQFGNKLFSKGNITSTFQTVDNIPLDGGTLTVYLVSSYKYNQYNNYFQRLQTFTFNKVKDQNTPSPATASKIISPLENSTVTSSSVTFDWQDVGASEYNLRIGTRLRAGSVRGSGILYIATFPGSTTSKTITNLLSGTGDLYAELASKINGRWYTSVSHYNRNIQDGPAISTMINPIDGSTLTSTTETFSWEDVGAKEYFLLVTDYLGKTIYSKLLLGTTTSKTLTNLPNDGHDIRVSLSTKYHRNFAGSNEYTYTSFTDLSNLNSEIISPANNSILQNPRGQAFYWKDVPAATEYFLSIGTRVGGTDLYSASQGLNTFKMITNLPTDGSIIFIRISSKIDNVWRHSDSTAITYKVPSSVNKSEITSPVNGSTLTSTTVTFEWQNVGASAYYLRIGTTNGWRNTLYRGYQGRNTTSKTVTNLPNDGSTVFVRLYSLKQGKWKYNDYIYTMYQQ